MGRAPRVEVGGSRGSGARTAHSARAVVRGRGATGPIISPHALHLLMCILWIRPKSKIPIPHALAIGIQLSRLYIVY